MLKEPQEHELAVEMRSIVLQRIGDTSLSRIYRPNPPVGCPFGEGKIALIEGAIPVSLPSYRIERERMEVHKRLVEEVIASGKVEPGGGPWILQSFLVPKKTPGKSRLVQIFVLLTNLHRKMHLHYPASLTFYKDRYSIVFGAS